MYEEAKSGPFVELAVGLEILAPINNSTVGKSFSVDGSFTTNGSTVSVDVTDKGSNSVATGTGVVANQAWNVAILVATPGVNPHTVTATVVGVAGSEAVFVTINGLTESDAGDEETSPGDD